MNDAMIPSTSAALQRATEPTAADLANLDVEKLYAHLELTTGETILRAVVAIVGAIVGGAIGMGLTFLNGSSGSFFVYGGAIGGASIARWMLRNRDTDREPFRRELAARTNIAVGTGNYDAVVRGLRDAPAGTALLVCTAWPSDTNEMLWAVLAIGGRNSALARVVRVPPGADEVTRGECFANELTFDLTPQQIKALRGAVVALNGAPLDDVPAERGGGVHVQLAVVTALGASRATCDVGDPRAATTPTGRIAQMVWSALERARTAPL